jgi:hypothetical protein
MRKIQLLGIALVAVCISCAFVTSAFALEFTPAKWLKNGVAITTTVSTNTEGELLFENLLAVAAILCSGLFEGTVGANGVDEITKVFSLVPKEIKELHEEGATEGIVCVPDEGKICEEGSEIWPINLPWKTQLDLDTVAPELFFDLLLENNNKLFPGYFILCLFLGASITELCEAVAGTFGELSNAATDVEGLGALSPESTCNGDTEEGLIENNSADVGLIALLEGTLQVSE